ncbi:hypothetical protein [Oerskovia turbata]|nr:hypothetical protein [Oerskovia turbata]
MPAATDSTDSTDSTDGWCCRDVVVHRVACEDVPAPEAGILVG